MSYSHAHRAVAASAVESSHAGTGFPFFSSTFVTTRICASYRLNTLTTTMARTPVAPSATSTSATRRSSLLLRPKQFAPVVVLELQASVSRPAVM